MISKAALLLALGLAGACSAASAGTECSPEIAGYYPAWARYLPFMPQDIDWNRVTTVEHAFLEVLADGSLRENPDYVATRPALLAEAQAHGTPVLASIGGWAGCTGKRLQAIAADPQLRQALAANLADYCTQHGYAGIGLDWEFPGMAYGPEPACTPLGKNAARCTIDRQNFVQLSLAIRASFDAASPPLQMNMTLPISGWFGECYNGPALDDVYERMEVMAYDMHGDWSGHAGHNAQLDEPAWDPHGGALSAGAALDYWIVTQGVDPQRLLLGVPFYGYEYPSACGLGHANTSGMSVRRYSEIEQNFLGHGWTRSFDGEARVPYLLRDTGCGVLSYDDPESLAAKLELSADRGLAGLMIWELSQDYSAMSGGHPLLEALAPATCCLADPLADCDGDGWANGKDCGPQNAGVTADPGEVPELHVRRTSQGALLTWTDLASTAGSETVYDVAGGLIEALRLGQPAGCVADDLATPSFTDSRAVQPQALFYIVRAQNSCDTGPYGSSAIDTLPPCP